MVPCDVLAYVLASTSPTLIGGSAKLHVILLALSLCMLLSFDICSFLYQKCTFPISSYGELLFLKVESAQVLPPKNTSHSSRKLLTRKSLACLPPDMPWCRSIAVCITHHLYKFSTDCFPLEDSEHSLHVSSSIF